MDSELQLSSDPVTEYELARIREERILDGWREQPADAPLPNGSSGDKEKDGQAENKDTERSMPRRKPLD